MPRIASLVPSGTDVVAALGLGDDLVGVSHECDHEAARGKPVLTSTNLPSAGRGGSGDRPPREVDDAVTAAVAAGRPLYRTDAELLAALAPDVVIAQDVCDVCAVGPEEAAAHVPPGTTLVVLAATTLAGLEDDIVRVGAACGAADAARRCVERLRGEQAALGRRLQGTRRRRVLALEWGDPAFLGGHWVPELVEAAGGEHVLSSPGEPSRRATWEEVAAAAPDVVVFCPCGYGLGPSLAEAESVAARLPPGTELWATDATRLFSRCTPQAVTAARAALAGILHPELAEAPDDGAARRIFFPPFPGERC